MNNLEKQLSVVQNNTSYYELRWGLVENPQRNNSWNWAAFFLTTFWLAYRKMYGLFFLTVFIELIWMSFSFFTEFPFWADGLFYAGVSLFIGWNGNRLYYKHLTKVSEQSQKINETYQEAYLKTKGGSHIGIALGLNAMALMMTSLLYVGFMFIPTETNIIDVVRIDYEGEMLESYADDPKWRYLKKETRYHLVEFTGYDYTKEEDVRIIFKVFFDKDTYDWKDVFINGKKLSEEKMEEYWIGG